MNEQLADMSWYKKRFVAFCVGVILGVGLGVFVALLYISLFVGFA